MAKPWARYEVGFIDHVKFRALTSNAICLWIEGKNYCDENMTDGLIPTHIVKQFRFHSRKSVDMLALSCGPKNETEQYGPLWESHAVGFKMHDYLDYNDCRDEAMERIDDANVTKELRKAANRERQKKFRAERKAALEALRNAVTVTPGNALLTPLSQTPTEASSPASASASSEALKERIKTAATPRSLAREPNPKGNFFVIEALAIEVLKGLVTFDSESDYAESVKCACALNGIAYGPPDEDADVVARACASARVKLVKAKVSA